MDRARLFSLCVAGVVIATSAHAQSACVMKAREAASFVQRVRSGASVTSTKLLMEDGFKHGRVSPQSYAEFEAMLHDVIAHPEIGPADAYQIALDACGWRHEGS